MRPFLNPRHLAPCRFSCCDDSVLSAFWLWVSPWPDWSTSGIDAAAAGHRRPHSESSSTPKVNQKNPIHLVPLLQPFNGIFQHVNLHKYKLNQHKVCISSWFTSSNILNRKHKIRDLLGFQKSSRKKEKLSAGGCDHRYFFFSLSKKGGQLYTIPLVTLGWWCPIRAEEAGSWPFLPLRAAAAC